MAGFHKIVSVSLNCHTAGGGATGIMVKLPTAVVCAEDPEVTHACTGSPFHSASSWGVLARVNKLLTGLLRIIVNVKTCVGAKTGMLDRSTVLAKLILLNPLSGVPFESETMSETDDKSVPIATLRSDTLDHLVGATT